MQHHHIPQTIPIVWCERVVVLCVFFGDFFYIYFASGCQDNKKRIKMNFMYQSKIDLDTSYLISLMNLNTCLACGMLFQHSVEVGEKRSIFGLSSVCSFSFAQHNFKSLEFRILGILHLMFLPYKFVCLFQLLRSLKLTTYSHVKVNQFRIQIHSIVKLNPVTSWDFPIRNFNSYCRHVTGLL